jgi:hypothetical protein
VSVRSCGLGTQNRSSPNCSQKQLEPDQAKYLTSAFLAVHLNQSISDDNFNPMMFKAPRAARWVTALWLTSLVIALIVALLAILAKQWLEEYSSRMRAPSALYKRWALRHVAFSRGMQRWMLDAFIGTLPFALHVSLLLFLAGLTIYFWALDLAIAICMLSVTAGVFAFYLASFFAPVFWPESPTQTPLLRQSRRLISSSLARGRSRHDPSSEEASLIAGRESERLGQVLAWMIKHLPAVEEVRAAILAIGSVDFADAAPSSICSLPVALAISRGMADLLRQPTDTQQVAALSGFMRARMVLERTWNRTSAFSLPPLVPASFVASQICATKFSC